MSMRINLSQEMKARLMNWKQAAGVSYGTLGKVCKVSPATVLSWLRPDGAKTIHTKHLETLQAYGESLEKYK